MKLLLVEDDLDLGNGVRLALQDQRFDVTWVRRIAEARPLLDQGACDLLVLDLGLPDGDGLSLLARVRRERKDLPILILTARDGLDDRLRGLDGGADDYVVKPFALAELLSRISALRRRSLGTEEQVFDVRGLVLNERSRRVSVFGREIDLSPSEFALLAALIRRPDRKSTRLNSSHLVISYAVFCLKKKKRSSPRDRALYMSGEDVMLSGARVDD